jgi:hypothetical protein
MHVHLKFFLSVITNLEIELKDTVSCSDNETRTKLCNSLHTFLF